MTQPNPPGNQADLDPIADSKCDMKKTQDLDVGAAIFNGTIHPIEVDSHETRKVLRKIDMFLLPILAFTYMIQVCYNSHLRKY